jgi:hypothetical protein
MYIYVLNSIYRYDKEKERLHPLGARVHQEN